VAGQQINYSKIIVGGQLATIQAMKKAKSLYSEFRPEHYKLSIDLDKQIGQLELLGIKVGRPSHRITLNQRKIKITSAEIISKKQTASAVDVDRINHLPTFEQVRLHTKQALYPGSYQIKIEYKTLGNVAKNFDKSTPSRDWLPSIDEPEAWATAEFEIKS
jgi:hypothetical protein